MVCCFFFNDTATTEIYTLSLHDALPICGAGELHAPFVQRYFSWMTVGDLSIDASFQLDQLSMVMVLIITGVGALIHLLDRKSTRLNSSHANISYAVFCLKKKHT